MQNRYAGDVGDFGKFGLLREIQRHSGCASIGINWYLTPDENGNADGKHVRYLKRPGFSDCDPQLYRKMASVVNNQRTVAVLENAELVTNAIYYNNVLEVPNYDFSRADWHNHALEKLKNANVVFLDPDNGVQVPDVVVTPARSIKYVMVEELTDYLTRGQSVIVYNHRARENESIYLSRLSWINSNMITAPTMKRIITFHRGTTRDYIFLIQSNYSKIIDDAIQQLLNSSWKRHFSERLAL